MVRRLAGWVVGGTTLAVLGLCAASCTSPSLPCETAGCGGSGGGGAAFTLSAPVEILRDGDGVVHVYGKTDQDVLYGAGYMQAADRLFQMDLMRRQVYGRKAEVLGEGSAGDDATIRSLDVAGWGKQNAAAAREEDPESYGLIEAWTAGVNARIEEIRDGRADLPKPFAELGYEPEPWAVEDAYVIGKTIVFENGNQIEFDLLASLIQKYQPDLFGTLPFFTPLADEFIVGQASPRAGRFDPPGPRRPSGAPPQLPVDARDRLRAMHERLAFLRPGASNNWAVGPELTENGRSMICGDPHQPLRSPSLMWMVHMNSADAGGKIDLAGWTFVGAPGVSLGHNRSIAWTATTNYPDVTDVWDVEVVDGVAKIGGEDVPIETREEEILVKDGETRTVKVEVVPGHGVLLPEDIVPLPVVDLGHRLLFGWTGYRVTHEAQAFAHFGMAETLDDFEAAVDEFELGSFNFIAADAGGITYRSSPIVPDRPGAADRPAYVVLDGADPDALWTGAFIPLEEMPHARGAADGVLVSANNDPFGFTADGSLADDPYYFGAYFDPGLRASRIHTQLDALAAEGPIAAADLQALQMDSHSLLADEVVPQLAAAFAKIDTDDALADFRDRPELEALMTVLEGWDRRMAHDEAGPVAFEAFVSYYVKAILDDDMGLFFEPVLSNSAIYALKFGLLAARDPSQALLQEGKDVLLLTALSDAAAFLVERFGSVDRGYTWADFHETGLPSQSLPELDGGSFPTDGGEGTVNVSESAFFEGGAPVDKHRSTSGAIYRMTATFDEDGRPRAFYTFAAGESGDPESPHFDDLTEDWVSGRYRELLFDRASIDASAAETFELAP